MCIIIIFIFVPKFTYLPLMVHQLQTHNIAHLCVGYVHYHLCIKFHSSSYIGSLIIAIKLTFCTRAILFYIS